MIQSTLRMELPPEKIADALQMLGPVTERVRLEPGCLACHVYLDALESNVLMFDQVWRSEEDLTRHLRSNEYRNVLLLMEMAIAQPEVRFNTIDHTSGFETVEAARS
jgi:quinol monooxygenase YgiN